jgi:hypothetical protein
MFAVELEDWCGQRESTNSRLASTRGGLAPIATAIATPPWCWSPTGVELRALRRLKRDQEPPSPFAFTSERGAPFTTAGWRKMVARLGVAAKLGFKTHPHMFRHACGFRLANQGTDTRTLQGKRKMASHSQSRPSDHQCCSGRAQPPDGRCTIESRSLGGTRLRILGVMSSNLFERANNILILR